MKKLFRAAAGFLFFALALAFSFAFAGAPIPANAASSEEVSRERAGADESAARWHALLDEYEAGTLAQRGMHEAFAETPIVLRRCGMENLPIKISKSILDKVTREKHCVPVSELRRLQENLRDPIAVFRSRTQDGSFVVLTDLMDFRDSEAGQNAVVAMKLGVKDSGGKREINAVASIHGRRPENVWGFFKEDGLPIYVNLKKVRAYLRSNGLRLPAEASKRGKILTEKDFSKDDLAAEKHKK